ncbi:bifunctional DNA primase/polymerase [Streptomyces kunmingensis]|uniref:Bifunctional DNA primase/polymerase n=1 Tax=Streptomyces kunmingensis TaxID=68225 RepID=A0ABU6CNL4_9ACTN|nr:bifunctional DNA primase/polymerase [Streptomyces kunmingensis]MEB3966252.1 bifunctional DNA primase/polymerase [Streptomyces kunmingensis]
MSAKKNAPAATGALGDQLDGKSTDRLARRPDELVPLDGALWLVRHGFPVFPCDHPRTPRCTGLHKRCDGSRGKHPTVAFTRAWTLDERKVHETFSRGFRNPAVAVGACSGPEGSRLLVVDSDRHGAIEDVASARGEQWPATMRVWTAKGHHDYLWAPAALSLGNGLGQLQRQFDGDVRAGNAYVIGPGARHASGFRYRLEDPERPPAVAPAWLLDALITKPTFAARRTHWRDVSHPALGDARGLVAFVLESRPGNRNNRLFWAACRAAEAARDGHEDARVALLEAAVHAGLTASEAAATIRSAYNRTGATA